MKDISKMTKYEKAVQVKNLIIAIEAMTKTGKVEYEGKALTREEQILAISRLNWHLSELFGINLMGENADHISNDSDVAEWLDEACEAGKAANALLSVFRGVKNGR